MDIGGRKGQWENGAQNPPSLLGRHLWMEVCVCHAASGFNGGQE